MISGIRSGNYRWFVCALLFFATTINYIDRQILSLIKPILDEELQWSNEAYGKVNAAFQASYALGLLFFGWFVDKFGTRLGYAVSIVAWSIAAIAHAFVSSARGFFAARLALGLGEGGNFPSAIKAAAQWFPKRERAFATSIFNAGTNAGAVVAPAIVPWIAFTFGWQYAFVSAGLLGFIWLIFWLRFFGPPSAISNLSPREYAHIHSDEKEDEQSVSWSKIISIRQTWSYVAAKFLTDPIWWFFLIWLPDYFKTTRGLHIKDSWVHLVTIYSIITVLSIAGGWFTGYLYRQGWSISKSRKTGMLLYAFCAVPIVAVTQVGDWWAVLLIALAGSAHQAWSANLYTTVSDMFPKSAVASVIGLGGMAGSVSGIFFPIYCGRLLDQFSAGGNVTAGYAILFGICALAYLFAFTVHHLIAPSFDKIQLKG